MQDKEKMEWVRIGILDAKSQLDEAIMWATHLQLDKKLLEALKEALKKVNDAYQALKDVEYKSYMRGD